MRAASLLPQPQTALRSSRWFFAFGIGSFMLVTYLGTSWQWLYTSATPLTTRLVCAFTLAVLLLVGVVHLISAYLLRHRVLMSTTNGKPTCLAGFNGRPQVELCGTVRKMRSNPELVGASGKAFFGRIQGRWYFVAAQAAITLGEYTGEV